MSSKTDVSNFFKKKKNAVLTSVIIPLGDTISDIREDYIQYVYGILLIVYIILLFICVLFNPYNITTTIPITITISSIVIIVVVSLLLSSEMETDNYNVQILKDLK